MTTIILAIPPEAQSRIRLIDLQAFLQERGLKVRTKIAADLITLTAHAPEPSERVSRVELGGYDGDVA